MTAILSISNYIIPAFIFVIVIHGLMNNVNVYKTFIEGVEDGFKTVLEILPTLVGLFLAISFFRHSGALALCASCFTPLSTMLDISPDIFSVAFVKMFSNSAATGLTLDVFKTYGPDSTTGLIVSIMMSSTETIFYTISVYCMSIGIKKTHWIIPGALICSIVSITASIYIGMHIL